MSYPRVRPGDPLSKISARLLNDSAKMLETFDPQAFVQARSGIMARNDTTIDLEAEMNVVALVPADAPIDPKETGDVVASAIKPDGSNPVAFVPLCAVDEVAPATVAGVVIVDVKMNSLTDTRADAITDETRFLGSGSSGPFEILAFGEEHDVDGEMVRRAAVRIGGGSGGSTIEFVQAVADGASGEVSCKAIAFKADITTSPNYEQSGDAFDLKYFKG